MMDPIAPLLIVLIVLVLIGVPVIAIIAFVRTLSVQRSVNQIPQLTSRVFDLEQRVKSVDRKVGALAVNGAEDVPPSSRVGAPVSATQVPQAAAKLPEPTLVQSVQPPVPAPKPPEAETPAAQGVPPSPGVPAAASHATVTPPRSTAAFQAPGSGSAAPPRPPAPPAPPHHTSTPAPPPPPPRSNGATDVESMIAGRWFNYVGILAVGLATALFLKYAFDNNWIGPGGRVTIGLLVGGMMYPLSQWVFNRGYQYYSEGIAGLGAGILYLSVWAGWHYYHIFPQSHAFPLMIAITAATAVVAIGRNSERIAVLALAGGLLTPLLVSTGENEEVALFSYLIVLGGGMLAIAWARKWRWIAPLQFAGTLLYFWGWYAEFYGRYELGNTVLFATVFFAVFAALPAVRSTREGELSGVDIAIVLTNAFQYLIALRLMLWPEYRWGLTLAVLGLAAAHLLAERALPRKSTPANQTARMIYAGLALTFATLAIPIRLDGKWITIAFAVEGALLIWSGLRIRSLALRTAGFVLFAIVGVRLAILVFSAPRPDTFLLNERFLTLAIGAAAWLAAFLFAKQSDCELGAGETQTYYFLAIAANFCFLLALSMDVWDLFGRASVGIDRSLAQELALSVLWIVYAFVMLVVGMLRKEAVVRWQGLGLLLVAIVKLFFFDLWFLTRFYRIISFFVLGLVLLAVSFFYQKRAKALKGS
jgi:uncharacterized membrane protein